MQEDSIYAVKAKRKGFPSEAEAPLLTGFFGTAEAVPSLEAFKG
jgi:hypothetical protein